MYRHHSSTPRFVLHLLMHPYAESGIHPQEPMENDEVEDQRKQALPKDLYREALERMMELDEPSTAEPFTHEMEGITCLPELPGIPPPPGVMPISGVSSVVNDDDGLTPQERLRIRHEQQLQQLEQLQLKGQKRLRGVAGANQEPFISPMESRLRRDMDLRG